MNIILFFQSTVRSSWRQKLAGAYRFARDNNWLVQVVERATTPGEIRQALARWRPDGCLVDRALSKGAAPDRLFKGLPVVYLDQNPAKPSRRYPCLVHDSAATARLAGDALLMAHCSAYAYLDDGNDRFWDRERGRAFREMAHERGIRVLRLHRATLKDDLRALTKPCGVLAATDMAAIDVYQAALTCGYKIPADVMVAGIDNDEMICESVTPGLTSVEPDFEGAGYRLAARLAEVMAAPQSSRAAVETYGPRRLVMRGSIATGAAIGDARVAKALAFVREHACETDICLERVACAMGCSRKLATMRFRAATGHSILDEIHAQRLARICELLKATRRTATDIIYSVGYSSESFPKKLFRRHAGMTMSAWRTRCQSSAT